MTGQPRVLVVGEALVDVVHRQDGTITEYPGGSPANVALGLGRLHQRVDLLTDLGADDRGRVVTEWLHASGVSLLGPAAGRGGRHTSTARAHLDAGGAAVYEFDLGWDPDFGLDPTSYDVVHTGSIAATLEPGGTGVVELVARMAGRAVVTYDPNARPAIMGDPDHARSRVEELVGLSDVVKASDEDVAWLYPGADPHEVIEAWRHRGPAFVTLTLGGEGAIAATRHGLLRIPAPPTTVVDTVGAGDTFMAALVDGLIGLGIAGHRELLAAATAAQITAVLERAAKAAALNVARPGADPPTADELGPVVVPPDVGGR